MGSRIPEPGDLVFHKMGSSIPLWDRPVPPSSQSPGRRTAVKYPREQLGMVLDTLTVPEELP